MGIEVVGTALAIGSAVMGVVQGISAMNAASAQYDAQQQQYQATQVAASQNLQSQYQEITRQQDEVMTTAGEQKSDRMRQAQQELGALRVAMGEMGSSGSTFTGAVRQLGYYEGLDLSRVDENARRQIEAGESQKRTAQQNYTNSLTVAGNQLVSAGLQRDSVVRGAGLSIGGTLLNVGTTYYTGWERRRQNALTIQAQQGRTQ